MPVRDTSLLAYYEKVRKGLGPDEDAVFRVLLELGPCHDRRILQALNQKDQVTYKPARLKRRWEINQVTARRNGLLAKGVIEDLGPHDGRWEGRPKTYHIWRLRYDKREPPGWSKIADSAYRHKTAAEVRRQRAERTERTQQPILRRMQVSEAGRILQERRHRKYKGRRQTIPTGQGDLFAK